MAFDKLVDSTQLDADLATVADAIRTKGGTSAQLAFPNGMAQAIEDLPSGEGTDTYVGTYKILHETVTLESAYSGNVVSLKDLLVNLSAYSDKKFIWFAQKPKDSYVQNDWYCMSEETAIASNLFGISVGSGYRYRDGSWAGTRALASYDAAATAGSQFDLFFTEYANPI